VRLQDIQKRWPKLDSADISKDFPREIELSNQFGEHSTLVLPKPLTVIFGLNGTGKTRLLSSLSDSMDGSPIVSMYALANYLLHDFGKRDDIDDLRDENGPLSDDKVMSAAVGDLVRRDYESITWHVVSIVDSPFLDVVGEDVVPIFSARHKGIDYDFRNMGLGELSAHLLMWILSYGKDTQKPALLLDEPEAFLPPPSRTVLLAHLLETCITGGRPLVIASHSMELIQPALDANAAIMLTDMAPQVSSVLGPSPELAERVAGVYGRTQEVDRIFFLEDEAAFMLWQEMIRTVDPRLWRTSRFLWCTGYGDLEKLWSHLPHPKVQIAGLPVFAFVADGDKEASVETALNKARKGNSQRDYWPFLCLPGDPDVLMKAAAIPQSSFISERLGLSLGELEGFLESKQGREAHNWVEDMLGFTQQPRQEVLRALAIAVVRSLNKDVLAAYIAPLKGV